MMCSLLTHSVTGAVKHKRKYKKNKKITTTIFAFKIIFLKEIILDDRNFLLLPRVGKHTPCSDPSWRIPPITLCPFLVTLSFLPRGWQQVQATHITQSWIVLSQARMCSSLSRHHLTTKFLFIVLTQGWDPSSLLFLFLSLTPHRPSTLTTTTTTTMIPTLFSCLLKIF